MQSSPNRFLAITVGGASLVLAVLGFAVTFDVGFAANEGAVLFGGLRVNGLQNTLHLLIGTALFLGGQAGVRTARAMNTSMGALYLVIGMLGLFLINGPNNVLALTSWGNAFHFAAGAVLLGVALAAEQTPP